MNYKYQKIKDEIQINNIPMSSFSSINHDSINDTLKNSYQSQSPMDIITDRYNDCKSNDINIDNNNDNKPFSHTSSPILIGCPSSLLNGSMSSSPSSSSNSIAITFSSSLYMFNPTKSYPKLRLMEESRKTSPLKAIIRRKALVIKIAHTNKSWWYVLSSGFSGWVYVPTYRYIFI